MENQQAETAETEGIIPSVFYFRQGLSRALLLSALSSDNETPSKNEPRHGSVGVYLFEAKARLHATQ
jgi:hypothetical protein